MWQGLMFIVLAVWMLWFASANPSRKAVRISLGIVALIGVILLFVVRTFMKGILA